MAEDVRVVALLHARPAQEGAVREAATACVAPTRAESGCDLYVLHRDSKDASLFVFVEHWTSQGALDRHMQTPHFKALTQALEGKLAEPMSVHILHPLGDVASPA